MLQYGLAKGIKPVPFAIVAGVGFHLLTPFRLGMVVVLSLSANRAFSGTRETSLERLTQTTMDKLCSVDCYPSDSYVFSYCGYDLPISSERVADAFAGLSERGKGTAAFVVDCPSAELVYVALVVA